MSMQLRHEIFFCTFDKPISQFVGHPVDFITYAHSKHVG